MRTLLLIVILTALAHAQGQFGGGSGGSGSATITCADTRVLFADGADTPACDADLVWDKTNNYLTGPIRVRFGGTTSSFPMLKRSSAALEVKLADDSDYAVLNVASVVGQGTTAGYIDLPQGSTNGTGTTSARIQSPAAVTSYVVNMPAAAPTNNNSGMVFTNASPAVGSFVKQQQWVITSGSAYTNATTTFSSVVGSSGQTLAFAVEASTNYTIDCHIIWQGSANTTGPKFQFTGPGSPTAVAASQTSAITVATASLTAAVAFSSSMPNAGTITTATNFPAHVRLGLVNGANAGTVTLQAAANGVGTLTIQPGSFCVMQ